MFRFSIRDLLLVTMIVALAVGWWGDHRTAEIIEAMVGQRFKDRENELLRKESVTQGRFEDLALFMDRHGYKVYTDGEYGLVIKRPGEPETIHEAGLQRISEATLDYSVPTPHHDKP